MMIENKIKISNSIHCSKVICMALNFGLIGHFWRVYYFLTRSRCVRQILIGQWCMYRDFHWSALHLVRSVNFRAFN